MITLSVMATAVIIGNGLFPRKEYPRYLIQTADLRVCCDGALKTYLRYGFPLPDAVVGDMDSLPDTYRKRYADIIFPESEQEDNDQTKAIRWITRNRPDIDTIHILGATGRREDHTIGNLSLLMEYERTYHLSERGIRADIVSDTCTAFAITDSCELHVGEGRAISIFSPDNSVVIRSEGLEWPLDHVVFDNWWKATLNRANADVVKLTFSHPALALIVLN